ncbi:parallel beta-helix domain-containing protein [uncultured Maricaulis sp.]|uniref:parallel beta-helix domain-containing protein n=1 Tax=uncultured Maricaulis sp. TaxID=174710 RepID=UPI0030D98C0C|tara:strand:- start:145490 stop:146728 length:1239 start_codon:yes stop_codon:yes gene_type:complete
MIDTFKRVAVLALAVSLAACGGPQERDLAGADHSYQNQLIERLIDAQAGDVIEIPEGVFAFDRSLSLTVDGVTLRGQGPDRTILTFQGQVQGAEGLLVTANDFTIENLAIEDTAGDGLKINEGENIIIRGVRVEWTAGPRTENGAYGIYPVQTTNVLIEDSIAIGASDAGIYVGQSHNVVIRRNRAERNVAGIEVENTIGADVYDNVATENTGGILVFNMPNLPQPGYQTRVYNNHVFGNNTGNFGHAGTPVASIPAGSGIVVNSNDLVEIFDNDISDNRTANIIISSLHSTGYSSYSVQEDFDPYPEGIYIHGNRFTGGGDNPDGLELQGLKLLVSGPLGRMPDVLWDGYWDAAKLVDGVLPDNLRLCLDNGEAQMVNADGPNDYASPAIVTDQHRCTLARLPVIELASAQ